MLFSLCLLMLAVVLSTQLSHDGSFRPAGKLRTAPPTVPPGRCALRPEPWPTARAGGAEEKYVLEGADRCHCRQLPPAEQRRRCCTAASHR